MELRKTTSEEVEQFNTIGDEVLDLMSDLMDGMSVAQTIGVLTVISIKIMATIRPDQRKDYINDLSECIRNTAADNNLIDRTN